jgi:hypothetical protein
VAELKGGVFPPTLRGAEGIEGILSDPQKLAERFAANAGKDSLAEVRKSVMNLSMNLGATFGFLSALSPEKNNWHYAGKDVKLNTPDRPIFWYRRAEASMTYFVLYADLTIKEVSAEELPKPIEPESGPTP